MNILTRLWNRFRGQPMSHHEFVRMQGREVEPWPPCADDLPPLIIPRLPPFVVMHGQFADRWAVVDTRSGEVVYTYAHRRGAVSAAERQNLIATTTMRLVSERAQ